LVRANISQKQKKEVLLEREVYVFINSFGGNKEMFL
jgi:hypothetical protein